MNRSDDDENVMDRGKDAVTDFLSGLEEDVPRTSGADAGSGLANLGGGTGMGTEVGPGTPGSDDAAEETGRRD